MVGIGIRPIVFSYHQDIDEKLQQLVGSVRFIDSMAWDSIHCSVFSAHLVFSFFEFLSRCNGLGTVCLTLISASTNLDVSALEFALPSAFFSFSVRESLSTDLEHSGLFGSV
jgi:hypothetical protein